MRVGSHLDLGSDAAIGHLPVRDKQELKAEYKEALKNESKLQSEITCLDERITQVMTDDNNSRPMLLQEKETLLDEIRRLNTLVKSEGEKVSWPWRLHRILSTYLLHRSVLTECAKAVKHSYLQSHWGLDRFPYDKFFRFCEHFSLSSYLRVLTLMCCFLFQKKLEDEKDRLAADLSHAREVSNRATADRIQLQAEKSLLVRRLDEQSKITNLLNMRLKKWDLC